LGGTGTGAAAADGGFIKPLVRAAPVIGSSFEASFAVAARVDTFTSRGTPPLYSGLLSLLVGPVAAVIFVIGLSPEMFVYRSESGAASVDGFISFDLSTKGCDGGPNRFVSEKAALGFAAKGRA
jgi:hypothetical protein